jgi:hypothetical protein
MFTHAKEAAYAKAMYLDRLGRSLIQRQQLTLIYCILSNSGKHELMLLLLLTQVAGMARNKENYEIRMPLIP